MSRINEILQSAVNNVQNSKKEFNAEEWGKAKQQDREFAYKTQNEMAKKIMESGANYKSYLDVQSRFPTYSVGTALLVTAQNLKATQLKDAEIYEKEDGTEEQNYNPKNVYDVSDMRVKRKLNTIPFSQESIMKSILSMSPVEVRPVENTSSSNKLVNFNVNDRVIEVSENAEVEQIIRGLIREIAGIHTLSYVDSELNRFKNESVAYMICKRYGVSTKKFNFDRIPEVLKQMTPQEVKEELSKGRECFEILTEGMDRDVGM